MRKVASVISLLLVSAEGLKLLDEYFAWRRQ
jgi:hypothetical protein